MTFRNPIVGGVTLRIPGIESPDFVSGSAGDGWRIGRDGTAELNNVTVRGTVAAATITGSTITGNVVRTAATGRRIEMRTNDNNDTPPEIPATIDGEIQFRSGLASESDYGWLKNEEIAGGTRDRVQLTPSEHDNGNTLAGTYRALLQLNGRDDVSASSALLRADTVQLQGVTIEAFGTVQVEDGTAAAPGLAWRLDTNFGVHRWTPSFVTNPMLGFANNGDTRLSVGMYNSSDPDITALVGGSSFGSLILGHESAHVVLALRENDAGDSFSVISGGGNFTSDDTFDTAVARFFANGTVRFPSHPTTTGLSANVYMDTAGNIFRIV